MSEVEFHRLNNSNNLLFSLLVKNIKKPQTFRKSKIPFNPHFPY
jgi:hypothetical protein